MKAQKCCAHCPGIIVPAKSNESHECCQPKYISGNLRIPSLTKHVSECSEQRDVEKNWPGISRKSQSPCYDQFALAKKLHAENLEHQPLPDKVEDAVFKIAIPRTSCHRVSTKTGKCCDCCGEEFKDHANLSNKRYGSALGCKEPRTKMDLAICWETPIDPVYEPPKPSHIDGSDGGLAPAIFTLVQRGPNSGSSLSSEIGRNEECCQSRCKAQRKSVNNSKSDRYENENKDKDLEGGPCECLCRSLSGASISNKARIEEQPKRVSLKKCVACEPRSFKDDPRLIKSAVGLALGLEKEQRDQRRNGSKITVPKPKTPFAKRSFRIDTLTPPFSVVNGCRGTDYPEHWRLMSVYQQSYKNPYRRRNYR
ncbi:uncharacterized protein LOC128876754 [Hylaeus volcanicus]|uniref:uncharacterized protein LOC128876754 n=1 Tax=Hylaeus volcanicus TaxID=313075 RepID=UPI0023B78E20|nr:uncharacterized protein LOC128876754 [Hylaeus volcanicus]